MSEARRCLDIHMIKEAVAGVFGFTGLFVRLCIYLFFCISYSSLLSWKDRVRVPAESAVCGCLGMQTIKGAVVGACAYCVLVYLSISHFFSTFCLRMKDYLLYVLEMTEPGSLLSAVCRCLDIYTTDGAAVGAFISLCICIFMLL